MGRPGPAADVAPLAASGTRSATVADAMIRHPKVLPPTATVAMARASLTDDHVHMVLLVEDDAGAGDDARTLLGTLVRSDLPPAPYDAAPALPHASLAGRTVVPEALVHGVHEEMAAAGVRRLAVVDDAGRLLGLLCLKRHRRGFCDEAGVRARAADR